MLGARRPNARGFRRLRAVLGHLACGGVAWTVGCASSEAAPPEDPSSADAQQCLHGTRWEPRLSSCVADAPEDDALEAMCGDGEARQTRDIMSEVQDLERQRTRIAEDDPARRDVARRLASAYEELGCATLREANDADARRKRLKDEPDRAAYLEEVARRARKIHDSARESARRYRRELKVSERR